MTKRPPTANAALPISLRWLLVPVVGWAVLSAAAAVLRRRARQPASARMSGDWLRENNVTAGRNREF